jgi:coatomer subunit beta'
MELALSVATDPEHRFDLALALGNLNVVLDLAKKADQDVKWKMLGDAALAGWNIELATEAFTAAKDYGSLLLIHSSTSNRAALKSLADAAEEAGVHNITFSARWLLGDIAGCIEVLEKTGRYAEAVLFSQTYKPSSAPKLVTSWKESLEKNKKGRVAKLLGAPGEDDLFPEWEEWLRLESEGGAVTDVANGGENNEGIEEMEAEVEAEVEAAKASDE